MVIKSKVEVVAVAYLNLKIPYGDAEALVSQWDERYPQYDYQTLAQWIVAGDVAYGDGQLEVAAYVTPEDLENVITRMRSVGGVAIKNRRYKLRIYPNCFVGSEAVQWLMGNFGLTVEKSVRLGQRMVERAIIHHVLDEQDFENDFFFYRFYADE